MYSSYLHNEANVVQTVELQGMWSSCYNATEHIGTVIFEIII